MISKTNETSVPIIDLLANRWSPRAFTQEVPDMETLKSLFEAARWAPSSSNAQPWHFIVGIKGHGDTWEKVFNCLDDGNQLWCQHVPALLLCVAGKERKPGKKNYYYMHDAGQAMAYLTIQAMSKNIYVHQMAGIHPEKAVEIFGLNAELYEPITCAALGYRGDPEILDEKNKKDEYNQERHRRPLAETVFTDEWGKPMF
jgi:nitroreductase